MEISSIDFAALCKELRAKADLTQQAMAEKLGATLNAFQKWEAGDRVPSTQFALKILALRDELLSGKSQGSSKNKTAASAPASNGRAKSTKAGSKSKRASSK